MKRVLIITYYWPPAGGIGVLRCLKFAKYLRQFGWEPIIYTPSNADYSYYDETNLKDIPDHIEVIKHPIREPFRIFKLLSRRSKNDSTNPVYARGKKVKFVDDIAIWIRGNFFIPDARAMWISPSVKYLKDYLKDHPVDAIFTDGPPHTNTVIGLKLSQELGIPWLADFQDPWTQVDYYKMFNISMWADKKHRKLEQLVFKVAEKITIASPAWVYDLESIGAKNVDVLYYGYDEDDFVNINPALDSGFTIIHAGLLGYDRNPEVFFKVLGDLKSELDGFDQYLKIKFAGDIDFLVKKAILDNGLQPNFIEMGVIDRSRVLEMTMNAHLLLLPINKAENAKGRIPGKLYENLRAKRPILCLGPKESDVANILKETNAGVCFEYDDYINIKNHIKSRYELYLKGENNVETHLIDRFSNENQTKKLSQMLNNIIDV